MNRPLLVMVVTLCLGVGAIAQERPKLEIFGGYSLEDVVPCGFGCRADGSALPPTVFNGWDASLTGYLWKSIGVTADFSGHYATHIVYDPVAGAHRYSYLFGPAYKAGGRVGSVFVHALVGEISEGSSELPTLNYTKFAWDLGGGLDVVVTRRLSLRPVQLDYERSSVPATAGATQPANGLRYSGGVVFKF